MNQPTTAREVATGKLWRFCDAGPATEPRAIVPIEVPDKSSEWAAKNGWLCLDGRWCCPDCADAPEVHHHVQHIVRLQRTLSVRTDEIWAAIEQSFDRAPQERAAVVTWLRALGRRGAEPGDSDVQKLATEAMAKGLNIAADGIESGAHEAGA
jgi:rubredoxin